MILITGATGNLGQKVIKALKEKDSNIEVSALVRDIKKGEDLLSTYGVKLIEGNYDNYTSLVSAFQGVSKLYFVSGNDMPARGKQHENVVNAAIEAKVGHVIYTSFERRNETATSSIADLGASHIKTEELLKASGLAFTIMRHNLYHEAIGQFLGSQVLETGTVFLPAGEGRVSSASQNDMAKAAANVLTSEGYKNKIYDITGSSNFSFEEVAQTISEITGKDIKYVSPSAEQYEEALKGAGLPKEIIDIIIGFATAIKDGDLDLISHDLETIIGEKPTTIKDFLTEVYK